jgi:signal transduction histidine kinase
MLLCIAEIFVCAGVITSLNFYYSGIALPVLADLVYHTRDNSRRLQYMFVLIMLFALGQYDIVPFAENRIPFSAYLGYYSPQIRGCLSGIVSVLASLNVLLFVYFMVLLFAGQKAENKRILNLYDQLKAANERLRDYARELEHMTEIRERNRLAREIHDTLGHTLTGGG